jgi:hypothetical protein
VCWRIVGGRTPVLYGTASDASGLAAVSVCLQGLAGSEGETCGAAELVEGADRWTYTMPDLGALDYVSRTVAISAVDGVGNRTAEPLVLSGWVDNVAPVLAASQVVSDVVLGRTATVLNGTVEDGSEAGSGPAVDVSVRVQPADGDAFRADTVRDAGRWRFDLAGTQAGVYTLWVDADDAAGNRSSAGPFEVQVTCADAAVTAVALTAEPSPAGGKRLTLRTTIRNAGPDAIPAGLPFVLYGPAHGAAPVSAAGTVSGTEPVTPTLVAIGTVTTTLALAAGESESFAVDWTMGAPAAPDWQRLEGVAYAGAVAPAGARRRFAVTLQDVPLYAGWNLISPPVEPFNTDVATVQRPIAGSYRAILGYANGLQIYDPQKPAQATLRTIGSAHGYWIRTQADAQPVPADESWRGAAVARLRMAGQMAPEEQALRLNAGWNLAGYLPQLSLPITVALEGSAVTPRCLFNGTAVSPLRTSTAQHVGWCGGPRPATDCATEAVTPNTLHLSMTLPITAPDHERNLSSCSTARRALSGGKGAANLSLAESLRVALPARWQPGAHQLHRNRPRRRRALRGLGRHYGGPLRPLGLLRRRRDDRCR